MYAKGRNRYNAPPFTHWLTCNVHMAMSPLLCPSASWTPPSCLGGQIWLPTYTRWNYSCRNLLYSVFTSVDTCPLWDLTLPHLHVHVHVCVLLESDMLWHVYMFTQVVANQPSIILLCVCQALAVYIPLPTRQSGAEMAHRWHCSD